MFLFFPSILTSACARLQTLKYGFSQSSGVVLCFLRLREPFYQKNFDLISFTKNTSGRARKLLLKQWYLWGEGSGTPATPLISLLNLCVRFHCSDIRRHSFQSIKCIDVILKSLFFFDIFIFRKPLYKFFQIFHLDGFFFFLFSNSIIICW